jgi:hypothetical protein
LLPSFVEDSMTLEHAIQAQTTINITPDSTAAMLAGAVPKQEFDPVATVSPATQESCIPEPETPGPDSVPGGFPESPTFEKGAKNFPLGDYILPDVITPAERREAEGKGVLDLPFIAGNMIPESSFPISGGESASEAHSTPDNTDIVGQAKSTVTQAAQKTSSAVTQVQGHQIAPCDIEANISTTASNFIASTSLNGGATAPGLADSVFLVVKESIAEAGAPAEATAVTQSGDGKEEFASELVQDVSEVAAAAPVTAPIAQENSKHIADQTAPIFTDGITTKTVPANSTALSEPVQAVPEVVKKSIAKPGVSAEGTVVNSTVRSKELLEEELKKEIPPTRPLEPLQSIQQPDSAQTCQKLDTHQVIESSYAWVTAPTDPTHAEPQSPTTAAPVDASSPKKSLEAPSSKASKRRGFFGRLRDRFFH